MIMMHLSNATMPNGIWLKTGQDWLGRMNECLPECVVDWEHTGLGWSIMNHNCLMV